MIETENDYKLFEKEFNENGFFVWPQLFPEQKIDAHLAELEVHEKLIGNGSFEEFHAFSQEKKTRIAAAQQEFYSGNTATQELSFNERLMLYFQWKFAELPILRIQTGGLYSRGTRSHHDALYIRCNPKDTEIRVWVALEDVHPDSGPVYFVPRSHSLISKTLEEEVLNECPQFREVLAQQRGSTTEGQFARAFAPIAGYAQRKMELAIAKTGLPKMIPALRKGDAVLFSLDLVHGTAARVNKTLTRKHLILSWCALSASWYHARAYWGPSEDFRRPENRVPFTMEKTPYGLRIANASETFRQSFTRPILTGVAPAIARLESRATYIQ